MARLRLKPERKVTYYHVTTRTAQKFFLLQNPEVKSIFLDLIDFYSQVYYVKILAYVVMSNHYHLALEVSRPTVDVEDIRKRYEKAQTRIVNNRPWRDDRAERAHERYTDLSRFMWEINSRMAKSYNKLKQTSGHLWGGRFKSQVVEEGEHLRNVIAYIELNPVRAGITKDPTQFPHSSVARIKRKLDKKQEAKVQPISFFKNIPDHIRAPVYVSWIRNLSHGRQTINQYSASLPLSFISQDDFLKTQKALIENSPGQWEKAVYGSTAFTDATMAGATPSFSRETKGQSPGDKKRGSPSSPT